MFSIRRNWAVLAILMFPNIVLSMAVNFSKMIVGNADKQQIIAVSTTASAPCQGILALTRCADLLLLDRLELVSLLPISETSVHTY